MKSFSDTSTKTQKEALVNEFKGNLFEYLVASFISRDKGLERSFLSSFGGNVKRQFSEYETWLRMNDPELLKQLPVLARNCANTILTFLPKEVQNIFVIGKSAGGSHRDDWKECDIMIVCESKNIPISLKLCKGGAFVNTKSAGVKSLFTRYFSSFEMANDYQMEFSQFVDDSFVQMGHELYQIAGLDYCGKFDSSWVESGYSELPGQLSSEMQEVVLKSYKKMAKKLHEMLSKLYSHNPSLFSKSLLPLMGIGDLDILQVTCFHTQKTKDGNTQRYLFKENHAFYGEEVKDKLKDVSIANFKEGISSFEILVGNMILQLRIKPMNKFTTASYKINCSIKG